MSQTFAQVKQNFLCCCLSAPGCSRGAVWPAALVKQACGVILGIWPRRRWRDSGQIFIKLLCNYRDLLAKCLFSFLAFLFGSTGSGMSACFVSLKNNNNDKVTNATRTRFMRKKKMNMSRSFLSHLFCLPAGDLRSLHTLPVSGAQGRLPSGAGSADALQHSGGPDQPGLRLPAGGAGKVAPPSAR